MNRGTSDATSVEQQRSAHLFAAGMTLASLLTGWAYSLVIRPNYLVGRYDLVAWPACMIWFALLISSVGRQGSGKRSGWPALAICAAMLACSLLPIARMAALKPGPTFANVRAQRLAQLAGSRDLAITFSYDRDYLLYYLHRAGFTGRIVAYPSWLNRQVGWVDLEPALTADMVASLTEDAAALVAEVDAVIARGGRVWVLLDSYEHRVDAHGRRIPWPRSKINLLLIQALKEAGFQRAVADEKLLLFTLHR